MDSSIINNYTQAANAAALQADKYRKQANTYSLLRLGIFALMVFAVYLTVTNDDFTIMAVAFIVLLAGFAWLVSKQAAFERQRDYYLNLQRINENEITSLQTSDNIYSNGQQFANDKHLYTSDLDIFGNASLYQLINRAATTAGNFKLAAWLDAPASKDVVLQRQDAVKEIAAKNEWKKELQTLLLFAKNDDPNRLINLFKFLKMPLNFPGERALGTYAKVAPYLLVLAIVGALFLPLVKSVAILIALVNLGIVASKGTHIKKADMVADKIGTMLGNYAGVFNKIESEPWQSAYNNALAQKLKDDDTSAKIKELSGLISKLNYHLNIIVGVVLNATMLWDIRQIIAIENWKRNNQQNIEHAFDVIADFEAIISIATTNINYPEWVTPVIADTEGYTLKAKNIAHPLIRTGNRVDNDYDLNNTFGIDIITGSNMAGKSTFLRTIGINSVLALAGANVCASVMEVSVITIVSYMRIKDSLNESTSTFKAELDRLQMLLAAVDNEHRVFFLIDEMLRGTNSVDKYLGSKAVIEQLIAKKGVGMVATHDLQIARLEDKYPGYVRNYYFDIRVENDEMLFDYKLKHGECKTFNASLLLKRIGIEVGE
ncbi:DNA mismatch repair protein MutS [Mucilaginibacter pallidiroseus]|uniref:DNA mismatch repair protein MutS n=1 Tax=Mucilaginibacter pallidiroseus TaxID=2599295 RepID=A0A563U7V7_9SPHI|nr:DNA mismatch repair protein MutS [Mucilaginibacter pallidiroseus]TWR27437.1 DNA mismatch repair protein MutS [Mucilaginibacter pallidiroseus]